MFQSMQFEFDSLDCGMHRPQSLDRKQSSSAHTSHFIEEETNVLEYMQSDFDGSDCGFDNFLVTPFFPH